MLTRRNVKDILYKNNSKTWTYDLANLVLQEICNEVSSDSFSKGEVDKLIRSKIDYIYWKIK